MGTLKIQAMELALKNLLLVPAHQIQAMKLALKKLLLIPAHLLLTYRHEGRIKKDWTHALFVFMHSMKTKKKNNKWMI
jgi:hypothetical protein